jgi:hypothetical protein
MALGPIRGLQRTFPHYCRDDVRCNLKGGSVNIQFVQKKNIGGDAFTAEVSFALARPKEFLTRTCKNAHRKSMSSATPALQGYLATCD